MADNLKYKVVFKMDIEHYFSHMLDVILTKKRDFLTNNITPPEVIFIDWETYKKIEISNQYQRFEEHTLLGLEFVALPINTELLELGYKDNGKNVDLGIRSKL